MFWQQELLDDEIVLDAVDEENEFQALVVSFHIHLDTFVSREVMVSDSQVGVFQSSFVSPKLS